MLTRVHRVGEEWFIDAAGCRPDALRDLDALAALLERVIAELDLHVLGAPQWHRFPPPGGITGLVMLTESHLTLHTYPEVGIASFNLYCCRERPVWPWAERLADALGAAHVAVRRVARDPSAA
jgi:S-adenosylmethionine decarboxylase